MKKKVQSFFGILILLGVISLSACSTGIISAPLAVDSRAAATPEPTPKSIDPFLPPGLPIGFSQLIPFDGIYPIYTPYFAKAEEASYHDEELVLGVAWGGEAKAYSISVLRFREMVNDELAGIPTLVTY